MVWIRSVKTMYGDYYNWLVDLIEAGPGTAHEDYTSLIHELYLLKYRWQFELDENRAIAGLALRDRYAYEAGVDRAEMSDGPCSVLEMLIGLADVMSQTFDDTVSRWFWEMIGNLNLDHFSDGNYGSCNRYGKHYAGCSPAGHNCRIYMLYAVLRVQRGSDHSGGPGHRRGRKEAGEDILFGMYSLRRTGNGGQRRAHVYICP